MQIIMNFFIENYFVFILVFIIGITFCIYYKFNKNEILSKISGNNMKAVFSKKEYEENKKRAEAALNNTTISFSAKNVNNLEEKMNLYYRTIVVGNHIIKAHTFSLSDVGEI